MRESLRDAQRELLDDYIAACEAMDDAQVRVAYRIGREQGTGKE